LQDFRHGNQRATSNAFEKEPHFAAALANAFLASPASGVNQIINIGFRDAALSQAYQRVHRMADFQVSLVEVMGNHQNMAAKSLAAVKGFGRALLLVPSVVA